MEKVPSAENQSTPITPTEGQRLPESDDSLQADASAAQEGDVQLVALEKALQAQADKLRDVEVELINRIADVDDDRRRTATEVRRTLDTQHADLEEAFRRRGMLTVILFSLTILVALGAASFSYFQTHVSDTEFADRLQGIQEAVDRLSAIDTAPIDERLGQLDQAVTRLSGDLEAKVVERQAGVKDLASRLQGLEETLASQHVKTVPTPDALVKEVEARQAAIAEIAKKLDAIQEAAKSSDADLRKRLEGIEKEHERLGKDMLLLRDSLADTLASANLPMEKKSFAPEESKAPAEPAEVSAPPATEAAAPPPPPAPLTLVNGRVTLNEPQFTLQLASFGNLEQVQRFAQRDELPERLYYRKENQRGKPIYMVFDDFYPDKATATKARESLPAKLAVLKPVVRQLDARTQLQVLDRTP